MVSLFAEVEPAEVSMFVRDRGHGFDPAAVPGDRKGLAESIHARMARRGGTATVRSAPGEGTEVALTMPRAGRRARAGPGMSSAGGPPARRPPPRVFLVDDHGLFRSGVRAELGDQVEVVGEADDVAPAIALIAESLPDVVLLDVHLPGGGGQAVVAAVRAAHPQVRFLALSASDAPEDVIAVIRAGARGYVTKTISGPDLVDAVRRVAAGDAVFSPRLAGFVLDAFAAVARGRPGPPVLRPGTGPADPPGAGGAPAHRPGLHLQGDRAGAVHLGQDRGEPRVLGAAQAPAVHPAPADPMGDGAAAGLVCCYGIRRRTGPPAAAGEHTGPNAGGTVAEEFPSGLTDRSRGCNEPFSRRSASQIANYQLAEEIGRGGMAVVYRARDARLDRWVALKVLSPEFARDEAFRQRFIRESRAAAAVEHPNIIPIFDAGEADGVLFIAMRYVSGQDVHSLLHRAGPLPAPRAIGIITQVAAALDAAHDSGLVHRDVKPANMLLGGLAENSTGDHVYLSDFGISKAAHATSNLTLTGQVLGTLNYLAPEQVEGRTVDGRADGYALACAAFEMLAGSPPFRRDENLAVMWAQVSAPPPPLTEHRPDLPPAVRPGDGQGAGQVPGRPLPDLPGLRRGTARGLRGQCRRTGRSPALAAQGAGHSPAGASTGSGRRRDGRTGAGHAGQPGGRFLLAAPRRPRRRTPTCPPCRRGPAPSRPASPRHRARRRPVRPALGTGPSPPPPRPAQGPSPAALGLERHTSRVPAGPADALPGPPAGRRPQAAPGAGHVRAHRARAGRSGRWAGLVEKGVPAG